MGGYVENQALATFTRYDCRSFAATTENSCRIFENQVTLGVRFVVARNAVCAEDRQDVFLEVNRPLVLHFGDLQRGLIVSQGQGDIGQNRSQQERGEYGGTGVVHGSVYLWVCAAEKVNVQVGKYRRTKRV